MSTLLRTERIVLRPLAASDVDDLVALNADPDVMRFIARQPPTRDQVAAEVDDLVLAPRQHPGLGRFVAEDPDGRFLGWLGLVVDSPDPLVVELGYRLRRSEWGRGLATEGSRVLIEHAFTRTSAARVVAETMAVNTASRRVMEKCGMRHVRTFQGVFDDPLPGTESGEVVYEIRRDEWRPCTGES